MRILHLGKYYPPYRGGIENYLQHLIQQQSGQAEVDAIVANDRPVTQVDHMDGAAITRVARFGVLASMPLTPALPWHIARSPAQVIHLHVPNPGAAAGLWLSRHPGRLVVTHHADTLGRPLLRALSDPFVRAAKMRAHTIIVTSRGYLNTSEELQPYRDKCRVIPLGVNPEFFAPPPAEVAAELKRRHGEGFVLAVGRLVPYKGFEYLIRAMRAVSGRLVLIGSGPLEARLRECAREAAVTDKVFFAGDVAELELRGYFEAAGVFVMPSITRAEAFGIVQAEAMASGLPVINTRIPSGVPEVSTDGATGLTVPPMDPEALAAAMQSLLVNETMRKHYGEAARQTARRRFSYESIAAQTMAVYVEALNAR